MGRGEELDKVGVKPLLDKNLAKDGDDDGVALVGIAAALEDNGVAGSEPDGDDIGGDVGARLIDDAHDAHGDTHTAYFQTIGHEEFLDDLATRGREACDIAGVGGYGLDALAVETEAVVAVVGGVHLCQVDGVGSNYFVGVGHEGVGHSVEGVGRLLGRDGVHGA